MKNTAASAAGRSRISTRKLVMTAMLSAVAFILMYLELSVPFMPQFIKLDFSDLPELIGSFAMGPLSGAVICLLKNLLHILLKGTTTGGVGELSNFLLGCFFVVPAGLIYKVKKTKKFAAVGAVLGALIMAGGSMITNYYLVYPIYTNFMPMENIIAAYQAILPGVDSLFECLLVFNVPFTFVKGVLNVVIALLIYKPLSPIIKGTNRS